MKANQKLPKLLHETKVIAAFALLVIVAAPPLSVAAFAQSYTGVAVEGEIADSGLTIVEPAPPEYYSDMVHFDGNTSGWIILGGIAYQSNVHILGDATFTGEGVWDIDAEGRFEVVDRYADLKLSGFAVDDIIVLHGRGHIDTGEPVSVFLRGHFAPTHESGVFALAFTHASIYNVDQGERYPLMQTGSVNVYPVPIEPMPLPEPMPEEIPELDYFR